MHVYLKDHFVFLVSSFFVGMLLSLIYDVFRVLRVARGIRYSRSISPERTMSGISFLALYNRRCEKRKNGEWKKKTEFFLFLIEDIIYSLLCTVIILVLIYGANYGIPRFFSFVGMFFGFLLCRITVGKAIMLASEYICYFIGAVFFYLFYPFSILFIKIKKVIYKLYFLLYNRHMDKKIRRISSLQAKKICVMLRDLGEEI